MKRIFLIVYIIFAFITAANAGAMYSCSDRDGNKIITDNPQDGMIKCVLVESDEETLIHEPTNEKEKTIDEKDNAIEKANEAIKTRNARINNCISCCNNKNLVCYNYTANGLLCAAENKNCDDTCNSEGASPSSWSDCWSQSGK